jgi:hypothetical protein
MNQLKISISFLIVFCVLIGCHRDSAPSFIHIPQFEFVANPGEGTSSQKITEVWVYANEQMLGAFDLPADIPCLSEGRQDIRIFAGIKNNGLGATRIRYPFYMPWDTTLVLQTGDHDTLFPVFNYFSNLNIEEQGFESGNVLVPISGNEGSFSAISDNRVFEGTKSNLGLLPVGGSKIFFKDDVNRDFTSGQMYFLEMNYSCNNKFAVGLIVNENSGEKKELAVIINPTQTQLGTPSWNKIYIDFGNIPQLHPNANYFEWYIEAIPDDADTEVEVYLDNLKWVKW